MAVNKRNRIPTNKINKNFVVNIKNKEQAEQQFLQKIQQEINESKFKIIQNQRKKIIKGGKAENIAINQIIKAFNLEYKITINLLSELKKDEVKSNKFKELINYCDDGLYNNELLIYSDTKDFKKANNILFVNLHIDGLFKENRPTQIDLLLLTQNNCYIIEIKNFGLKSEVPNLTDKFIKIFISDTEYAYLSSSNEEIKNEIITQLKSFDADITNTNKKLIKDNYIYKDLFKYNNKFWYKIKKTVKPLPHEQNKYHIDCLNTLVNNYKITQNNPLNIISIIAFYGYNFENKDKNTQEYDYKNAKNIFDDFETGKLRICGFKDVNYENSELIKVLRKEENNSKIKNYALLKTKLFYILKANYFLFFQKLNNDLKNDKQELEGQKQKNLNKEYENSPTNLKNINITQNIPPLLNNKNTLNNNSNISNNNSLNIKKEKENIVNNNIANIQNKNKEIINIKNENIVNNEITNNQKENIVNNEIKNNQKENISNKKFINIQRENIVNKETIKIQNENIRRILNREYQENSNNENKKFSIKNILSNKIFFCLIFALILFFIYPYIQKVNNSIKNYYQEIKSKIFNEPTDEAKTKLKENSHNKAQQKLNKYKEKY